MTGSFASSLQKRQPAGSAASSSSHPLESVDRRPARRNGFGAAAARGRGPRPQPAATAGLELPRRGRGRRSAGSRGAFRTLLDAAAGISLSARCD
ncbi:hypothetical protein ZWY2020_030851 [Hordeum vulgare]|nr:hypothetical protein ZWY2020_030851 [Hordeum vulgare]